MKISLVLKICISAGVLLVVSALWAQAAGLVSFENNNKIIVWDSLKMAGKGLRMTPDGINDLKDVGDGQLEIMGKDLYVRSFMGFDCPNYPKDSLCAIALGNITGSGPFLVADTLKGSELILNSNNGFSLNTNGDKTVVTGNLFLTANKNLVNTSGALSDEQKANTNTVFTDTLNTATIEAINTLTLPGLQFSNTAVFDPAPSIILDLTTP